ncbi:MAG: lactonase family protein [Paludibacter sp.]
MKRFHFVILFVVFNLVQPFYGQVYHLLVGTYTNTGKSDGIYTYVVDFQKNNIIQTSLAKGVMNPSFLVLTEDDKFVYSVNQNERNSTITAFSFKEGNLHFLNKVDANGEGPCYITASDNHVFTANYSDGSLCVFARKPDGTLFEVVQKIQHVGKSINKERQNQPHVHQVILSPDNKYLIANDLGTDKVTVYSYNPSNKSNVLISFDSLTVKLGSGPRHATFNKDGKRLYLVQEIDGTVSVIEMNNGRLKLIQETTVITKKGVVARAADIHLTPDEKFLYVTNRGIANDITCFSVSIDGKLSFVDQISTGGDGPRNFSITPDGQYIFVAHQFTDNIKIFKRNFQTGMLTDTSLQIKVGTPVCLVFY